MIVLHCKAGGETDGENNLMLLIGMEEEWTTIEFKNWDSKTIIGCLEDKVWGKQV